MTRGRRWTDEEKELVRTRYSGSRDSVESLARMTGHPVTSVRGIVQRLGLGGARLRVRRWTPEEKERLSELITQHGLVKVAQLLKRSVNSVAVKAAVMGLSRRARDGYFTQTELSLALGVERRWIRSKIASGELKAVPINGQIPDNGGSRWHISERHARKFIIRNASSLTGRNVDVPTLVYILTGGSVEGQD